MQISTSDKMLLLLIQQNNRQLVGVETCRLLHTDKLEKTCLEINGLSLHMLAEADKT